MAHIPGPRGPIRFERRAYGYPHIEARDVFDGVFARGYLHAVDRLVQVSLSRVIAAGRAMELLGDKPLARSIDRGVRTMGLARGLREQVGAMRDDTRRMVQAYCDGFNAAPKPRGRSLLLRALGATPEPLEPSDVVLLYRLLCYFGLTSQLHVAEMVVAEMVAAKVPSRALEMLLGDAARGLDRDALAGLRVQEAGALLGAPVAGGSNGFAVDGRHSATGTALLGSEFHLETGKIPPTLYFSHVDHETGGYLQGVGMPGVPFVSAGRTEHLAWTYTFGRGDNIDVLVERCRAGRILAAGEWRPLSRRVERVKVRGRWQAEEWPFWDSEYGTVVGDASTEADLPCVRWAGLDEAYKDFDFFWAYLECRKARELACRLGEVRTISMHAVLADTDGDIAYGQTGRVDEKPAGWSGAVPRAAWDLPDRRPTPRAEAARPVNIDPAEGFLASANERVDGPAGERWCNLPEPPYRHQRLRELLSIGTAATLDTLARVSYDELDRCATRMMAVWSPLLPPEPEARALAEWAASQGPTSTPRGRQQLGLLHALHHEAMRALLEPEIGATWTRRVLDELGIAMTFQHHLDEVLSLGRADLVDAAGLKSILGRAWPEALRLVRSGRWPVPLRRGFQNALLGGRLPRALGWDGPPLDLPGGPTSLFQTRTIVVEGETFVGGPAFHLLFDLGKPGGWFNICGGASESRFGPGYGEGVDDWLAGRFAPLGPARGPAPAARR